MKPELRLLAWAALLALVQAVVAAQGAMLQVGLPMLAGNRDGMPGIKGWGGRAARAHRNMIENLVLFAARWALLFKVNSRAWRANSLWT